MLLNALVQVKVYIEFLNAGIAMWILIFCITLSLWVDLSEAKAANSLKNLKTELSATDIAKLGFKSTVVIRSDDGSLGSGFVVKPGLVATNFHVVRNANHITISVVGNDARISVKEVRVTDPESDLAILYCPALSAPPLNLGESTNLSVGDVVYAVGNPEGFEGTISDGLLSGIRNIHNRRELQTTAPISPGSSGGPLFNRRGQVIGVNTSFYAEGQNLNFAMPIEPLKKLIVRSGSQKPNQTSGVTFAGYYAPKVLISDMRDDVVYTPAGEGEVIAHPGTQIHDGKEKFKADVEIAAKLNAEVYCLLDGWVTTVGWRDDELGVAVEIYHPYPDVRTICGHLNAYSVMPGEFVPRGRVIGYSGSTGHCQTDCVSFTVIDQDSNEYVEPLSFLAEVPQYVKFLRSSRKQEGEKKLSSSDPKTSEEFLARGIKLCSQSDKVSKLAAICDFTESIRLKPDNASAFEYRGQTRFAIGDYKGAIEDCDNALKLDANLARAYRTRGEAFYALAQTKNALKDCNHYIRLVKEGEEFEMAQLDQLVMGIDLEQQGDYKALIEIWSEEIQNNQLNSDAYEHRGLAWFELGNYAKAIKDFDAAIRLNPKYANNYSERGRARLVSGDTAGALTDFTQSLALKPDDVLSLQWRGDVFAALGKRIEAEKDFKRADAIQLNTMLEKENKDKADLISLSNKLKSNPKDDWALFERADVRDRLRDYQGEIADRSASIAVQPSAVDYERRGDARLAVGDQQGAIQDYSRGLKLKSDPNTRAFIFTSRAKLLSKIGDQAGAVRDLDRVIQLQPVMGFLNRGDHYLRVGALQNAIGDYSKTLILSPTTDSAYLGRAKAKLLLGNYSDALQDLKEYLKFAGWRGDSSLINAELSWLCYVKLGQPTEAEQILRSASAFGDRSAWPFPIIERLFDKDFQKKSEHLPSDITKITQLKTFVGIKKLFSGDTGGGMETLNWVRTHGDRSLFEYQLSMLALKFSTDHKPPIENK